MFASSMTALGQDWPGLAWRWVNAPMQPASRQSTCSCSSEFSHPVQCSSSVSPPAEGLSHSPPPALPSWLLAVPLPRSTRIVYWCLLRTVKCCDVVVDGVYGDRIIATNELKCFSLLSGDT